MDTETVYRFKVYDIISDDFVTSTRMATTDFIRMVAGQLVPGTETVVAASLVQNGRTERNFKASGDALPKAEAFPNYVRK